MTPDKAMRRRRDIIAEIGCIVCLREGVRDSPCTWHHLDGQKTQAKHELTIGLCTSEWGHHGPNNNPESRHNNKAAFEAKHGTEQELLEHQNKLIEEY